MVEGLIGTWSGVARRSRRWRHGFARAEKVWGRFTVSLQEAKNSVLDSPPLHVAMTIALPGLVATAMTLQHMNMNLIAMQFAEGSVTQIF